MPIGGKEMSHICHATKNRCRERALVIASLGAVHHMQILKRATIPKVSVTNVLFRHFSPTNGSDRNFL